MRDWLRLLVLFLLAFCLPLPVYSESGAEVSDPIYVVDMQRVFSESIMGKAASNNLEQEMKKKKVVLEKQKMELDKLQQELQKQSSLLSAEALRTKEQQFIKKQREFERSYEDLREELALKNKNAMENVLNKINKVIDELAEKKNYKLIMEKDLRVIVYADNKYDISEQVIKELDNLHVGL